MSQVGGSIIDCFAPRPLTGSPVAVFETHPGLEPAALDALATAVAMPAVTVAGRDPVTLACAEPTGGIADAPTVAMAAVASLGRSGGLPARICLDDETYRVASDRPGQLWIGVQPPTVAPIDVPVEALSTALGLEREQIAPVIEQAPLAVAAGAASHLVVPVTYLSALAAIAVDTVALRDLCAAHGADAVFCYSFDTLTQGAAVHGRPVPHGQAHPVASATGALACISALRSVGALGGASETVVVEQGDHWGRPTRMTIDTSDSPRIGGRVQHTGELTLEAAVPGDTILE